MQAQVQCRRKLGCCYHLLLHLNSLHESSINASGSKAAKAAAGNRGNASLGNKIDDQFVISHAILQSLKGLCEVTTYFDDCAFDQNDGQARAMKQERRELISDGRLTLVEACLCLLTAVAKTGKKSAKELYRCNVTALLETSGKFANARVVKQTEQLYQALADRCEAAVQEIKQGRSIHGLVGMLHSAHSKIMLQAISSLLMMLDGCSGNDYLWFTAAEGGLAQALLLMQTPSKSSRPASSRDIAIGCGHVFLLCLDRSRRMANVRAPRCPRGGVWDVVGRERILELESSILHNAITLRQQCSDQYVGTSTLVEDPKGVGSSRGASESNSGRDHKAAIASEGVQKAEKEHRCVIKKGSQLPRKKVTHKANGQELNGAAAPFDEDGLRVVWDSEPKGAVKAARNEWKSVPLSDKIGWHQTSTDVSVSILLPQGTKKRDVIVDILPDRLCLKLGWHGRVVDGPLHRRVKAQDSLWTLEEAGIQILLVKDEQHYWKALFDGGEERGYYELLQEAVNADEPLPSYDELDFHSKSLIEDMQERQREIAEGSFDLEKSFDDFRVVIGENCL